MSSYGINCSSLVPGQGVPEGPDGTSSFIMACVINLCLFALIILAFSVLRPIRKDIYESYESSNNRQPDGKYLSGSETLNPLHVSEVSDAPRKTSGHILTWLSEVSCNTSLESIEEMRGVDGVFYIKLIKYLCLFFLAFTVLACITLIPTNTNGGDDNVNFKAISISNIKSGSNLLWVCVDN